MINYEQQGKAMAGHIIGLFWALFVIGRYFAAVVVAFWASIATVSYLPNLFLSWTSNGDSPFWDFIWFFFTGLAGVAAGSFFVPRKQWWIGSLFLLFLGLGFALWVFCTFSEDDPGGANLFPLVPLAAGGIIPMVIHYLLRPKSARTSSIDVRL